MSPTATERPDPFIKTSPGDLITSDLVNEIQIKTLEEIAKQVAAGVAGVKRVEHADDSDQLEGKTAQELSDEIVRRAMAALPSRTGYKVVYKRLHPGEPASIRHDLAAYPLVDIYQLADFPAVVSADEVQSLEHVHWYLYHRTEMKIRNPEQGGDKLITIEESRGPVFKHTFQSMLDLYGVEAPGQSTLGDVVNEFWKALFSDPNDQFDETAYANSPWFDRCCGDRRTVESLKRGGEWNDLFLKVMPVKTLNILEPRAPLPVLVEHYNLSELGLWWMEGTGGSGGARDGIVKVVDSELLTERELAKRDLGDTPEKVMELTGVEATATATTSVRERLSRTAQAGLENRFFGQAGAGARHEELRVMVLLKV